MARNFKTDAERERKRIAYWSNVEKAREEGRAKFQRRNVGHVPHPKYKTREALRNAVKDGSILKPDRCQRCNKKDIKSRIHGHHHDYSKPLEVEWLCSECHGLTLRKGGAN